MINSKKPGNNNELPDIIEEILHEMHNMESEIAARITCMNTDLSARERDVGAKELRLSKKEAEINEAAEMLAYKRFHGLLREIRMGYSAAFFCGILAIILAVSLLRL